MSKESQQTSMTRYTCEPWQTVAVESELVRGARAAVETGIFEAFGYWNAFQVLVVLK